MTIRKDDPAMSVRGRSAPLDKKGTGAGDDLALNGQLPPGQYIENQLESQDVKRIVKLRPNKASAVLASGTKTLNG